MAKKKLTPSSAEYEVGRGKPPRASQFKKGQSGNPGGRKKGSRNFKSILLKVLDSEIEIMEGGRPRKVSLIEAILLRQAQDALRGQPRAMDSILNRCERYADHEEEQAEELPEEDLLLLERALSASRKGRWSRLNSREDLAAGEADHD